MSRIVFCLDCPMYRTGGYCTHRHKDVGALRPACDYAMTINEKFNPEDRKEIMHESNTTKTEITPATTQTKLCKKCGRELPLDSFGKKKGTKDGMQYWCRECITKSVLDGRRAKKAAHNEPSVQSELISKPVFNPVEVIREIKDDRLLAEELRRRGWDVKATRPKTIIEEL